MTLFLVENSNDSKIKCAVEIPEYFKTKKVKRTETTAVATQ
jgi:hypothetical protein